MTRTSALLLALTLAGCVSAPKAAPGDEAAARRFTVVPGKAQLYIVRPSSYGLAVMYQVSIDGRIVGSLPAQTFLVQQLQPGSHVVSFFNNTSQENITVDAETDKIYFLRVGMNPAATSNRARMKIVTEDEGRELIRTNSMVASSQF